MRNDEEIRSSRGKTLGYLAISLGFVAIGIFLPAKEGDTWMLHAVAIFFGLGAAVFAMLLLRPQRLLLDRDGFTIAGGLVRTPRTFRWADVDTFFVYRLPRGGKMVGFNYAPGARPAGALADLARRFGADGALPKALPGSPEKLAERLNAYRAAALGRAD